MGIFTFASLLLILLLGVGTVAAQDDTSLVPFTDETYGITGVVPEGWSKVSSGIYSPSGAATDETLLGQQAAPLPAAQLLTALLPQFGLTEAPESVGTLETDALDWTLYKIDVNVGSISRTVDLALAEHDGTTYLVVLQTLPAEHDVLHESVFLPVLESFAPAVEATPEPDVPYTDEDVTFDNGDITLAGTLSLPEGDGPHPAIVLISGSGPQDRDESLAPAADIKPFKLIADYLAREGIAVLRYDDRGVGESTGDFAAATSADFATDAAAAIDYLLTRDEIDSEQIGVLGHSEGGLAAAILGASNPNVSFIILMAGTGVNGRDVLLLQNRKLLAAEGQTEEQIEQQIAFLEEAFPLAEAGDRDALVALIREQVLNQVEALSEAERASLGDLDTYADTVAEQQADSLISDWMQFFLNYDPAVDWAKVTVPVLAVFGGKDVQVDAEQNAEPLQAALEEAGNEDFEIVTLPNANHLFQEAETGGLSEYGRLPAEFTPDFLPTVAEWLLQHVTLPA
jgi:pimeloyl-ACP methyl ester carboxylesterase